MSNFKNGQLVFITTPDEQGIFKSAVEWCPFCYALIPEDFLHAHNLEMHPFTSMEPMKTAKVPFDDFLTQVSKRCEDEMERYSKHSKEYVYFVDFLDAISSMIHDLKDAEISLKLRKS